jgi:pimeloyl-ACP methyl ester carboxylesterase
METCATAYKMALDLCFTGSLMQLLTYLACHGASSLSQAASEQQPLLDEGSFASMTDVIEDEFTLFDGRTLGVAYFGAENGSPVFYFHGYPGCRLSGGAFFDRAATKLGARIIAIDRPGIGNSSPQPGRKLLDFASDVQELAEHLKLKSYGIIGVSGGGPYALACARALSPEKLKAVSIMGGMGPIDAGFKGMSWGNWLTFMGLMYFPWIIRLLQKKVVSVLNTTPNEQVIKQIEGKVTERTAKFVGPDVVYLLEPERMATMLDLYREHYKQGIEGYMEDGRVMTTDWGFDLKDIPADVAVQLWYSKKDTNVPFQIGEAIRSRLSSPPEFHVVEDETHLQLVLKCSGSALERLLEKI